MASERDRAEPDRRVDVVGVTLERLRVRPLGTPVQGGVAGLADALHERVRQRAIGLRLAVAANLGCSRGRRGRAVYRREHGEGDDEHHGRRGK